MDKKWLILNAFDSNGTEKKIPEKYKAEFDCISAEVGKAAKFINYDGEVTATSAVTSIFFTNNSIQIQTKNTLYILTEY